jgi:hypothetical protein
MVYVHVVWRSAEIKFAMHSERSHQQGFLAACVAAIGLLALLGCANKVLNKQPIARNGTHLYGDPVPAGWSSRTIVIKPETRHVNVEGGSTVTFVSGDKSFTWVFNGPGNVGAFDLNEVAPTGMLDHRVRAYVSPDMRRLGA